MKSIFILFSFLFASIVSFGQSKHNDDGYFKAREIIKDLDSIVTPNGVQENFQVNIGRIKQWVYVRGQNKENPIILFVHGGPASPMSPVMWMFQRPIEEYFTVVNYDQRAAGKTYLANDTTALGKTIRIEQYVNDAVELTEFIRKKYNKRKVILIGHSWGTIVSMKAVLKKPDLFYAYVGIGQVISTQDNERLSFNYGLEQATRLKHDTALQELQSIAPYPGNKPITRERIIVARKWPQYFGGLTAYRNNSNYFFRAPLLSPEYSAKEMDAINNGSLFTLGRILPEFLQVDLQNIQRFPIPVFMFMGRHDYTTPNEPTVRWLKNVKTPIKKGVWFENSAHLIPLEEPGKMLVTLIDEVRSLRLEKRDGK
jgi:pimeloyl-ACP methyl ester carboxylesterase